MIGPIRCSMPQGCLDPVCRVGNRLVLPNAQNFPAAQGECRFGAQIARDIRLQLRLPICPVGPRQGSVLWAPVPEAPVDEDRDTIAREDNVGSRSDPGFHNGVVDPKPSTTRVKLAAKKPLGKRVAATVGSHRRACCGVRRRRVRGWRHVGRMPWGAVRRPGGRRDGSSADASDLLPSDRSVGA
jgi:hypothetical protein